MLRATGLIFVLGSLAAAETQSGTVVSGGQSIPGATITAECGSDRISSVTDAAGQFEIGGLPSTPCRFSISMFGFEPAQREATASGTPLSFDLKLQTHATLAVEPNAPVPPPSPAAPKPIARTPPSPAAPAQTAVRGPGRGGPGRGGAQGLGRGGQNGAGFQNLSLVQNGDNPLDSADVTGGLRGAPEDANGSNEAFLVNGSLSNAVQSQPGDNAGLGGPGAFGPGGPGGLNGNPFGSPNGAAFANGDLPSLTGGAPAAPGPGGPGGGGRGGGGFGGGGGGRGGGGGGRGGGRGGRGPAANRNTQFGNRINRGRGRQFQGSVYYTAGNSVVNARPYSFTSPTLLNGQELPKAGYATNRFGFSGGGPLNIPHIFSSEKTFWFVNYTGNRSKNGFDDVTTVPTLAERQGNFSGIGTTINNPFTGVPFQGNVIPSSFLDPTAVALLSYIPLPNAPGVKNNYQFIGANPTNNDNLQVRINQTLTAKDGLDVNFSFQHRNSDTLQQFGFRDPTSGYGLSSSLTYRRTFNRYLVNSLAWSFSRNINHTLSAFSYGANLEGQLGISGVATNPAAYGPPTIAFTNFGTLTDATPSTTKPQTSGVSDTLIQIHGKQTLTYGGGFQRRENNSVTEANARGTFSFTGLETGYDLADFLLSLPQSTSVVRYTDNSRYLRETTLNAFVTDDYRMRSNLTINGGLRWEYFAPYTEKYGDMSNLDFTPGFTAVSPVIPGQTGPFSGAFPNGLIKPDYKLFSPRIGIAWKPWKSRQVVTRAGYGVYFNGGVYSQLASRMIGQPPFAQTAQLQTSTIVPLTLENGFPAETSETIANTFAVDKNYRPGYAQQWTGSVQETFARTYVVELVYNGTKGTNLDVLQLPNRALPGSPLTAQQRLMIPYASEFVYDNSLGNSTYNAAQVRLTRRFARGSSFTLLYTYSKAIDDSSTLGGGPVYIPNDISAERALSPTDQRHNLRVNYNYQSPIRNTNTGVVADLLRGWTIGGVLTLTSGTPFTAVVAGDTSGTGYTGNSRAEATGLSVTSGSGFFNPAAFTIPATGTFGNAGRDTIPGIPHYSLNASFFRSFRIDDKRRIEFRIDSTNPLNHPYITSINTTVNSIQYGLPIGAGPMRSATATVRLRF